MRYAVSGEVDALGFEEAADQLRQVLSRLHERLGQIEVSLREVDRPGTYATLWGHWFSRHSHYHTLTMCYSGGMSLQRDLTPAIHQGPQASEMSEAFTIIHVVPRDGGESYWMLLAYGERAEHRIDMDYREPDMVSSFFDNVYSYGPRYFAGFTHEGRAGADGKIVYAKSLQAAIDHLNGQT
jgi:hypothetical protein